MTTFLWQTAHQECCQPQFKIKTGSHGGAIFLTIGSGDCFVCILFAIDCGTRKIGANFVPEAGIFQPQKSYFNFDLKFDVEAMSFCE